MASPSRAGNQPQPRAVSGDFAEHIRDAQIADLPAILDMHFAAFPRHFMTLMGRGFVGAATDL